MEKIKKGFNFNVILFTLSALFFFNNVIYASMPYKEALRVPLLSQNKQSIIRSEKLSTGIKKKYNPKIIIYENMPESVRRQIDNTQTLLNRYFPRLMGLEFSIDLKQVVVLHPEKTYWNSKKKIIFISYADARHSSEFMGALMHEVMHSQEGRLAIKRLNVKEKKALGTLSEALTEYFALRLFKLAESDGQIVDYELTKFGYAAAATIKNFIVDYLFQGNNSELVEFYKSGDIKRFSSKLSASSSNIDDFKPDRDLVALSYLNLIPDIREALKTIISLSQKLYNLKPDVATGNLPFKTIKVPVMNSVEEMQEFVHKWKGYRFCTYLAYKDDKGWEESTSRRYMNKVLPRLIYLPLNIKAGDNEALERFYRICESEDAIIAINHTQPHKSNPAAKKLFGIQDENFDILVKSDKNRFMPYNLNGDAFSSWFLDEVGSYEGKDIVIFGVGGAGESIARNIINLSPRAIYLIDTVSKEQLSHELGENVYYFKNSGEAELNFGETRGIIFIFTAGKEFTEGLGDCLSFLENHRDRQNVFVDIRSHLELETVKKAKELGWRAYTGNGMNARNDYVLLMKIAEKMGIQCSLFEDFKQRVYEDSFLSQRRSL